MVAWIGGGEGGNEVGAMTRTLVVEQAHRGGEAGHKVEAPDRRRPAPRRAGRGAGP